MEIEAEREARKMDREAEAEARKIELETRRLELEAQQRDREAEPEARKIDAEIRMAELRAGAHGRASESSLVATEGEAVVAPQAVDNSLAGRTKRFGDALRHVFTPYAKRIYPICLYALTAIYAPLCTYRNFSTPSKNCSQFTRFLLMFKVNY